MLPDGYMGKILELDLGSGKVRAYPIPERMASLYLGGRGLGTALLFEKLLSFRDKYKNPIGDIDPLAGECACVRDIADERDIGSHMRALPRRVQVAVDGRDRFGRFGGQMGRGVQAYRL